MRVARFFALVLNSDARDYADEITWNCISRQPPHYSSPLAPSSGSSWELLDEREMSLASDGVAAVTTAARRARCRRRLCLVFPKPTFLASILEPVVNALHTFTTRRRCSNTRHLTHVHHTPPKYNGSPALRPLRRTSSGRTHLQVAAAVRTPPPPPLSHSERHENI